MLPSLLPDDVYLQAAMLWLIRWTLRMGLPLGIHGSVDLSSLLPLAPKLGMEPRRKFTPLLLAILYLENFIQVTDNAVKTGVS